MSKFNYRLLTPRQQRQLLNELSEVIAVLKNKQDIQQFLQQLLTRSEIVMLARRLRIAQALVSGKTYDEIRQEVGVGFSTVQLVERWLRATVGDYEDARIVYQQRRPRKKKGSVQRRRLDMPDSLGSVRHRYPGHFLLLNLLLDGFGK
jgi:TrpR-related protein YerC/YecD